MWLVFVSWVISYANEWEDHSNSWGTTFLGLSVGHMEASGYAFSVQTEDQDLVEFGLSALSWTHLILLLIPALLNIYTLPSLLIPLLD